MKRCLISSTALNAGSLAVEFLDKSSLQNSAEGTMELSRLTLYEEFTEPSQKTIGVGLILLEEATRRYDALDDEDNPLCFGIDVPDLTLQLSSTECKEKCEVSFLLSFFISCICTCFLSNKL